MGTFKSARGAVLGICFLVLMALPQNAAAYVDPGTTGMLSQILYVLFYGALGVFVYFARYLKGSMTNLKGFLSKRFGRKL